MQEQASVTVGLGTGNHCLCQALLARESLDGQLWKVAQRGHVFGCHHEVTHLFCGQAVSQHVIKEAQHRLIMMRDIRSQYVD